jgi:glycosyltransferase involved in cell wall biosynthesis
MNILFITQLFPADGCAGYTSGALREFVEAWGRQGHQVQVIRPHFSYEDEPFPQEPVFQSGDRVSVRFVRPLRIPLLKWTWYPSRKIINQLPFKPDVVICHLYNAYFTFGGLAKKLGVPLVIGIHMSDIRLAKNPFHRRLQRRCFKQACAFACRSVAYRQFFHQLFPEFRERTFLAFSGIPEKYLSLPERIQVSREKKRIITVTNLIKRKQVDQVLKALSSLPAATEWEYIIVGKGDQEGQLKRLAGDLDLTGQVLFRGELERDAVIRELREADVFILPSHHETFGLVYLEAMASGCLTIGSLHEGIDGIIRDGENGFLCDAANEASIRDTLFRAVTLPEEEYRRMVRNSLCTVQDFSSDRQARAYMDNLAKLLP